MILDKLNFILNYSNKNIKYYHNVFKKVDWVKSREDVISLNSLNQLEELPIINKKIIRENFKDLKSNDKIIKNYYKNSSGGSTGEKAIFLQHDTFKLHTTSNFLFFLKKLGLNPWNNNYFLIWGSVDDIGRPTLPKNLFHHYLFHNRILLNSSDLTQENLHRACEILELISFDYVRGYSQSLSVIAKFILQNKYKINQKIVVSTASKLDNKTADLIISAFNCELYDFYGSREVGAISYSKYNDKHNIFPLNNFVEIDFNENYSHKSRKGRLLLTNLNSFKMPLIRYDIGDQAECKDDFNNFQFDKIFGRSVDLFKLENGNVVDGTSLNHLLNNLESVKQFQIIQESLFVIKFKIVSKTNLNVDEINSIEQLFKSIFSEKCKFIWEYVSEIPLSKSGKRVYIISKVK